MILHLLIAMLAGWLQRHQQQVITYLHEENRVLKAQLGGRQLRLTDTERCRLAVLARPLGRKRLREIATIATPDTLLRWYKQLMAQKFDSSQQRRQLGRPRIAEQEGPRRDRLLHRGGRDVARLGHILYPLYHGTWRLGKVGELCCLGKRFISLIKSDIPATEGAPQIFV